MRILHTVQFYDPSIGGAQEVVKKISEQLVKRGHSVTVATTKLPERVTNTINGVRIEEFDLHGWSYWPSMAEERKRYQEFLLDSRFEVIMNFSLQVWSTDLVFPILNMLKCAKILSPCGLFGLYFPQNAVYYAEMPDIMRRYDHIIINSNTYRDADFIRKHGLTQYTIIPNGASEGEFRALRSWFRERYGIPEDMPLVLTIGSHTGFKGHRLAIDAFRRARIGRASLVIIGNIIFGQGCLPDDRQRALLTRVGSFGRKRVMLLVNLDNEDVIAALQAADLFLFCSNIECSPLVLFEAMASKTCFLTIACGNAEEIVEWSGGGMVLPSIYRSNGMVDAEPQVVARGIEELILDKDKRHCLAEAGYRAWQERFTWEKISIEYEHLYEQVLDGISGL